MVSNDLFRLVSLRQAKNSAGTDAPAPARTLDPRLRHREEIAARSTVARTREETLKARFSELTRMVRDLETVQGAIVKTSMFAEQDRAREVSELSRGRSNPDLDGSMVPPNVARSMLVDARLRERIEDRLGERERSLFRDVLTRLPRAELLDLDDLIKGIGIDVLIDDANRICAELRSVEGHGEQLPTVSATGNAANRPFVCAVGWGDLIVARETLLGYTAREIAHIENVLPGESKLREHQRLSKTENVEEFEVITEKETEKDTQTTDRYELQSQVNETLQRDFSVAADVNTSGQYGVTEVNTSLDSAFSQSQSQSRSSAVNTAREVVTKAVQRTYERVRKARRLTITDEIRELNRHELKNLGDITPPPGVSGMYLWVEKLHRVELRHYGTRMMVEFHS